MGFEGGALFMVVAESVLVAYAWIGWVILRDFARAE